MIMVDHDSIKTRPLADEDHTDIGLIEMDQEEIDAIIRNKRKIRDPKACYACHRRKVKCDRNLPCDSCVKRDHPELCSYERPTKKRKIQLSNVLAQEGKSEERTLDPGSSTAVSREHLKKLEAEIERLRAALIKQEGTSVVLDDESLPPSEEADREGVYAQSNQTGTMHLGSRSVLAYMIGNKFKSTHDAAMSLLERNILPNLGLDNETTTYPFVYLWSTNSTVRDISSLCKALPEDNTCREFWLTYRDIPCAIYPVVPDLKAFEETLEFMLQNRQNHERDKSGAELDLERPYGVTLPWLALFFAVLASGCQSTGRAPRERELTSQVFICCSYQALRMSNFMIKPTLETVQAMLIVGNALSYNMNPGVAYILLGMTLRSALSMGLHARSQSFSEHDSYLRLRVWWALAWQDSHFSVCYDRPSSSVLCQPEIPHTKHSTPGNRSYVESMSAIIKMTQEILLERAIHPKQMVSVATMTKYKDEVHRIWNDAKPRLRNRQQCVVIQDHLERLALKLHCSYMISEICRPVLKDTSKSPVVSPGACRKSSVSSQATTPTDPTAVSQLRSECTKYLEWVVDAYIELLGINKCAARSWVGIQRSIAAAFLLGIIPETKQEPRIVKLLTELERSIRNSALEDADDMYTPSMSPEVQRPATASDEMPSWVENMTNSLNVLSNINATLIRGERSSKRVNTQATPPIEASSVAPASSVQARDQSLLDRAPYNFDAHYGNGWNYGTNTMAEGAFGYVQPGLWGT